MKRTDVSTIQKNDSFLWRFVLKNDCPLQSNAMLNNLTTTISRVSKNMKLSSLIHHKRNYFTVSSSGEKQVSFSHSLLFSAWIAFEWQWSKVHSQICNHYNICMQQVSQIFKRFHKKPLHELSSPSIFYDLNHFNMYVYEKLYLMHNICA
jgi:hypothetical protein